MLLLYHKSVILAWSKLPRKTKNILHENQLSDYRKRANVNFSTEKITEELLLSVEIQKNVLRKRNFEYIQVFFKETSSLGQISGFF